MILLGPLEENAAILGAGFVFNFVTGGLIYPSGFLLFDNKYLENIVEVIELAIKTRCTDKEGETKVTWLN